MSELRALAGHSCDESGLVPVACEWIGLCGEGGGARQTGGHGAPNSTRAIAASRYNPAANYPTGSNKRTRLYHHWTFLDTPRLGRIELAANAGP